MVCRMRMARSLPEGEGVELDARIEKFDLDLAVGDGPDLPDQLMEARLGDRAVAGLVDVEPVRGARRLPVEEHAKSDRRGARRRLHHQMHVPRVKAKDD